MKIPNKFWLLISNCCLLASLSGCQGTSIGDVVEGAVAPRTSQIPSSNGKLTATEPIKPLPTITANPTPNIVTLPSPTANPTPNIAALPSPTANPTEFIGQFSDLETVPDPLRPLIQDLNKLAVLSPKQGNLFEPNVPVSRREFARWLVAANNRIYKNRPARQIRLSQSASDNTTFTDIPRNDPDFGSIQGLANAGLIGQPANKLFRPDATLTREDMLLWKVPLDLRAPLPVGSVDAVKQAWGFQDSDRISPPALRASIADAQAGDLANIRRSFGYTTLFQPQKPVSRAEAAAALWYFGTQTDGLSAQSALEIEQTTNQPETAAPQPKTSPISPPTTN